MPRWAFATLSQSGAPIQRHFLSIKSIFDTVRVAHELKVEGELVPNPEIAKSIGVELNENVGQYRVCEGVGRGVAACLDSLGGGREGLAR